MVFHLRAFLLESAPKILLFAQDDINWRTSIEAAIAEKARNELFEECVVEGL